MVPCGISPHNVGLFRTACRGSSTSWSAEIGTSRHSWKPCEPAFCQPSTSRISRRRPAWFAWLRLCQARAGDRPSRCDTCALLRPTPPHFPGFLMICIFNDFLNRIMVFHTGIVASGLACGEVMARGQRTRLCGWLVEADYGYLGDHYIKLRTVAGLAVLLQPRLSGGTPKTQRIGERVLSRPCRHTTTHLGR